MLGVSDVTGALCPVDGPGMLPGGVAGVWADEGVDAPQAIVRATKAATVPGHDRTVRRLDLARDWRLR